MKKICILIIFVSCLLYNIKAQEASDTEKVYRNELGIDVSTIFRQVLFVWDPNFVYYPALYAYYLSYRRHLNCGNIRLALGGDYDNHNMDKLNFTCYGCSVLHYRQGIPAYRSKVYI